MDDLDRAICSAKGCQVDAVWDLQWNNPKIHTPERRKSWLACDEHRASLSDFLGARGFLKDVVRAHARSVRRRSEPVAEDQPPIADIGRSGWRKVTSSMP